MAIEGLEPTKTIKYKRATSIKKKSTSKVMKESTQNSGQENIIKNSENLEVSVSPLE